MKKCDTRSPWFSEKKSFKKNPLDHGEHGKEKSLEKEPFSVFFSHKIVKVLEDKKALDVVCMDVREKFPLVDFMVFASGTSSRHLMTLCQEIENISKKFKIRPAQQGNEGQAYWIALDLHHLFVHLFLPDVRQTYNIEEIWSADTPWKDSDDPAEQSPTHENNPGGRAEGAHTRGPNHPENTPGSSHGPLL